MKVIQEEAVLFEQDYMEEIEKSKDNSLNERKLEFNKNMSIPI